MSSVVKAIINNNVNQLKLELNVDNEVNNDNYSLLEKRYIANVPKDIYESAEIIPVKNLSLVHVAAYYDSLECFIYLIQRGLKIDQLSPNDYMPLHYACWSGSQEVALYILKENPRIACRCRCSGVVHHFIYCAVMGGNPIILEKLFDNKAELSNESDSKENIIKKAIALQNSQILTLLLNKYQPLGNQNLSEMTPLMKSIFFYNAKAFQMLYDPTQLLKFCYIGSNHSFCSIFSLLATYDCDHIFKEIFIDLLRQVEGMEIEPPIQENQNQAGVCHWACQYNDLAVAKLLFKTGKVKINRLDNNFKPGPFFLISKTYKNGKNANIIPILQFLSKKGFDFNIRHSLNVPTVLEGFVCAISPNIDAIRFLVNHGADINAPLSSHNDKTLYEHVNQMRNTILKEIFNDRKIINDSKQI